MLTRQKVLLAVLEEAGRPLSATVFVKLMFLLRQETLFCDDRSYYDFVPYKFGPFSFSLYRDLSGLRRDGYITPDEEQVGISPRTRDLVQRVIADLPAPARRAVGTVVSVYGDRSQIALLRDVYGRYPWYATRSELKDLAPENFPLPTTAEVAIYTAGYEGRSVDSFFAHLLRSGILAILDVRANPISRKYGFARKSLADVSQKLGLDYHHLPELGIPGEQRAGLVNQAAYDELLDRYEQELLPRQPAAVVRAIELLRRSPSVLVCMERDVTCCHRGRLAKAIAKRTGLGVIHL